MKSLLFENISSSFKWRQWPCAYWQAQAGQLYIYLISLTRRRCSTSLLHWSLHDTCFSTDTTLHTIESTLHRKWNTCRKQFSSHGSRVAITPLTTLVREINKTSKKLHKHEGNETAFWWQHGNESKGEKPPTVTEDYVYLCILSSVTFDSLTAWMLWLEMNGPIIIMLFNSQWRLVI